MNTVQCSTKYSLRNLFSSRHIDKHIKQNLLIEPFQLNRKIFFVNRSTIVVECHSTTFPSQLCKTHISVELRDDLKSSNIDNTKANQVTIIALKNLLVTTGWKVNKGNIYCPTCVRALKNK